ncbi:MAG: hypothetical protein K2H03_02660, partial [Muribaculaceae bacterium]|nr:hypothetical protein [Muribaculaceae bacterium]
MFDISQAKAQRNVKKILGVTLRLGAEFPPSYPLGYQQICATQKYLLILGHEKNISRRHLSRGGANLRSLYAHSDRLLGV